MLNHPNNKIVSVQHPLQHYFWGQNREGRSLLDEATLSVKQETMPPCTAEQLHYHAKAQQFFFILSGVVRFDIEGITCRVSATEGIQIRAGQAHRIVNDGDTSLEFLLASRPSTADDRHRLYSDTNT